MPKKKSTSHHLLAGTFRPDRHARPRLHFAPASGMAPRYLSKLAKQEWNRVAPLLVEQGLLMDTDIATLAAYCIAYAGYRECADLVREQGQIVLIESQTRTGRTSKPIRNPAVTLMLDYQRAMLAAAAKFGFSPYDRERIEGSEMIDAGSQPSAANAANNTAADRQQSLVQTFSTMRGQS